MSEPSPTILAETWSRYWSRLRDVLKLTPAGRVVFTIALLIGGAVAVAGTLLVASGPDEDQLTGLGVVLFWIAGAVVAAVLGFVVWVGDVSAQEIRKALRRGHPSD